MFSFFGKKRAAATFEIDAPRFSITPNSRNLESSLKNAGIDYEVVADGYIRFAGCVFDSDIPLMIGIHFNSSKVAYISIFRPLQYCQSEQYDIHASYAELSGILKKKYGKPMGSLSALFGEYPREQWRTPGYMVRHYIMDRFGPEEHLHITFYPQ